MILIIKWQGDPKSFYEHKSRKYIRDLINRSHRRYFIWTECDTARGKLTIDYLAKRRRRDCVRKV